MCTFHCICGRIFASKYADDYGWTYPLSFDMFFAIFYAIYAFDRQKPSEGALFVCFQAQRRILNESIGDVFSNDLS